MDLPMRLDAVVFDCDGLLAETEPGWTRAETALFAEHGFPFGPSEKQLLIGGTLQAAGTAMAEYFNTPGRGPELAARLAELVWNELSAGSPALPGARDLVTKLRERGIPVAVASNSSRRFVDAALASAGLADLFETIVSADDVARAKPAPDLYLRACELLGADAGRSVAFEDSRTGVASARAAGMFVVGVPSMPDSSLDVDGLFESLADARLRDWAARCLGASPEPSE